MDSTRIIMRNVSRTDKSTKPKRTVPEIIRPSLAYFHPVLPRTHIISYRQIPAMTDSDLLRQILSIL